MDSFVEGRAQAPKRSLSGSLQPRSLPSGTENPLCPAPSAPLGASERLTQGAGSSLPRSVSHLEAALVHSGEPTGATTPSFIEGASQQVPLDPSAASGQNLPETASLSLPLGQGSPATCGSSSALPPSGPPSSSSEGAFTPALEAGFAAPDLSSPLNLMADLQSLDSSLDWTAVRARAERRAKKPNEGRTSSLTSSGRVTSRSRSPIQDDSSEDSRSLSERRYSASPPTKKGKKKAKSKKGAASQAASSQDGGRQ